MKSGPIILIEDDADDVGILEEVFRSLEVENKLNWFKTCKEAFDYLKTTGDKPFIILCDVNLPLQNGVEFKREIDSDPELRKKSIPFIFYSTSVDQRYVNEAYTEMTVQGFFEKASDFNEIRKNIKFIVDYWMHCRHPNVA